MNITVQGDALTVTVGEDTAVIATGADQLAAARIALLGLIDLIVEAEKLALHPWARTGVAIDDDGDVWFRTTDDRWRCAKSTKADRLYDDGLEAAHGPLVAATVTPEVAP